MLKFVHPSVIDLYLISLEQDRLNSIIDGYGAVESWPEGISDIILNLAFEINQKQAAAIYAVGSEFDVAKQLIIFNSMGGSA